MNEFAPDLCPLEGLCLTLLNNALCHRSIFVYSCVWSTINIWSLWLEPTAEFRAMGVRRTVWGHECLWMPSSAHNNQAHKPISLTGTSGNAELLGANAWNEFLAAILCLKAKWQGNFWSSKYWFYIQHQVVPLISLNAKAWTEACPKMKCPKMS